MVWTLVLIVLRNGLGVVLIFLSCFVGFLLLLLELVELELAARAPSRQARKIVLFFGSGCRYGAATFYLKGRVITSLPNIVAARIRVKWLRIYVVVLLLFAILVLQVDRRWKVTYFCCILNGKSRLLPTIELRDILQLFVKMLLNFLGALKFLRWLDLKRGVELSFSFLAFERYLQKSL